MEVGQVLTTLLSVLLGYSASITLEGWVDSMYAVGKCVERQKHIAVPCCMAVLHCNDSAM